MTPGAMTSTTYQNPPLFLTVSEDESAVTAAFSGRSTAREPGTFLLPILKPALERSVELGRPLVLDFQKIEYLNSSTITPVIRILEEAKRRSARVTVRYKRGLRWQEMSFSALEVFHSGDDRIAVVGA